MTFRRWFWTFAGALAVSQLAAAARVDLWTAIAAYVLWIGSIELLRVRRFTRRRSSSAARRANPRQVTVPHPRPSTGALLPDGFTGDPPNPINTEFT